MDLSLGYYEAVCYVESFVRRTKALDQAKAQKYEYPYIKRTQAFLDMVGNPEQGFRYIHVTGTAGKGTVSTMLHNALTSAGKKSGLFTSPFVTTTIEKIQVGDLYVSPEAFIELVEYVKPFIVKLTKEFGSEPSAFEILLIIALLYFKKEKCEWVVLEVGLGGRYDATNFIRKPEAAVITMIDYDHTNVLGKTLREIAFDKAGIIKKGSPLFTAEQRPALLKMFRNICKEKGAAFHALPRTESYKEKNHLLAREVARSISLSDEAIEKGIARTKLPARFEVMQKDPLVILDGAHNRAKIKTTIANLKELSFKKLYLLISLPGTRKDHLAVLDELLALPNELHVTLTQVKIPERKSVMPERILPYVREIKRKGTKVECIEDPNLALRSLLKKCSKGDAILAAGSFFLAGELRKHWISEAWVLEHRKSFGIDK